MAKFTGELKGADAIRRTLARLGADAPRALGAALYAEASTVMAQSKRLVPVETGALRSSGYVKLPEQQGATVRVVMGYGGAAAPYAVIVHEKIGPHHAPPTRAKYLEEPFRANVRGLTGRLASHLRRDLLKAVR